MNLFSKRSWKRDLGQVLKWFDIDATADGPASKNYVDTEIAAIGGGPGGVSDGDKGDITVSGSGTTWQLNESAMRKIMAINAA